MKTLRKPVIILLAILTINCSLLAQESDTNSFHRIKSFSTPWHFAFADMNLDGIQDMVGVYGNSNTDIDIYLGTANGAFVLNTTLDGSSGSEYYSVMLEDLNEDGLPDIIAVSNVSGIIFMSDAEGNYMEISVDSDYISFDGNATSIVDIDNDQKPDLIYNRHIHLNDGDGTFTTIDRLITGNGPIATLDYNDDGNLDLVVGDPGSGFIRFYSGNGDGTFSSSPNLSYEALVNKIVIYDLNNDGLEDIVFDDPYADPSQFIILYNDEDHLFAESDTVNLDHNFTSVLSIADFDLDGRVDIIGSNDNDILYWPVSQDGTIGEAILFEVGLGSIREFHYTNAYGEDFDDLVIVSGFGIARIYSDKLNASIEQTTNSVTYTGTAYNAIEINVDVDSVAIVNQDTEDPIVNAGEYLVDVIVVDADYEGKVTFPVSITKAPLEIIVNDEVRTYGQNNPEFEINYSGFVNGEDINILTELAMAETEALVTSSVGKYSIILSGVESINYQAEYVNGILTINEAILVVETPNLTIPENTEIPELELTFSGFLNGDDVSNLDEIPTASTSANQNSPPGQYEITLSGGEAENYSFTFVNGTLTIEEVLSVPSALQTKVYPNPVQNNLMNIESVQSIKRLSLTNLEGKVMPLSFIDNKIKTNDVQPGIYLLNIQYTNDLTESVRILIK